MTEPSEDSQSQHRFLPGYLEPDGREGYTFKSRRRIRYFFHIDTITYGRDGSDEEFERLALYESQSGDLITRAELNAIIKAVSPFYEAVKDEAIIAFNSRPPTSYPAPPQELCRPKTQAGFVYLLKAGPYYKIGVSTNVDKRIEQLATLPPFDIELVHTTYDTDMYALEKDLHNLYADKRKNGEWFELTDNDVEYVKGL